MLGGQEAWKNVQKTDSERCASFRAWASQTLLTPANVALVMQPPAQAAAILRRTSRKFRRAQLMSLQPCFSSVSNVSTSGRRDDRKVTTGMCSFADAL